MSGGCLPTPDENYSGPEENRQFVLDFIARRTNSVLTTHRIPVSGDGSAYHSG